MGDKNRQNREAAIHRRMEARETEIQHAPKGTAEAMHKAENDDTKALQAQETRRENKGFAQVYDAGWNRLDALIQRDPQTARLYAFIAREMGPDATLAASRTTLAEALGVSERTVSRYVKTLEEMGALVVLKMGTANVYALNPAEVWKSFDNAKPWAAFNTRTLVSKTENPFIKRRLTTLLNGKVPEQTSLPFDEEIPAEAAE